jgi:hypothetical protein
MIKIDDLCSDATREIGRCSSFSPQSMNKRNLDFGKLQPHVFTFLVQVSQACECHLLVECMSVQRCM